MLRRVSSVPHLLCRIYIANIMSTLPQERTTFERQLLDARLTKSILLSPQTKHLELQVDGPTNFALYLASLSPSSTPG